MQAMPPSAAAAQDTLISALRAHLRSACGGPVELVETHISWVLLTPDHAYKLKKPVRLPFVDFSTLASRLHFCEEELRLNQRLAPSLYLGVVPICGSVQAPRIDAGAAPIEYAVQMRRFPPGALLDELLHARALGAAELAQLAQRLADFHRAAPRRPPQADFGTPAQVLQAVLNVLAQLQALGDPARVVALRAWIQEQAQSLHSVWLARRRDGAVRECHGDLHLSNAVRLGVGDVTAFDCIEFDPALRWTDVMADVGFLSMDLRAHGRADLASGFVDDYLQRSGDYAGLAVLRFYEVYRALVRALVAALRARGKGSVAAAGPDYLACAETLVHRAPGPARVLITQGLSGSGKSSVARQLLEATGAVRLRSDVERKRLFGLDALQRSASRGVDIYTAAATRSTVERLLQCASTAVAAGYPVIVDAAFLRQDERHAFRAAARRWGVPFAILECRASVECLRARVSARGTGGQDASEADLAVLERQLLFHQPLDEEERAVTIALDTEQPLDLAALCAAWRGQADSRREQQGAG